MKSIDEAKLYLGKQETLGPNDGPLLRTMRESLLYAGSPACSWCALFVSWCLTRAYVPETRSAKELRASLREAIGFSKPFYLESCHDWYTQGKALGLVDKKPQAGDLFLLLSKDKRAHHIGFVTEVLPEGEFGTIEGNANTGGSNNGDGVYERTRNVADAVFFHLPAEFLA
jgi:hypothetical protein